MAEFPFSERESDGLDKKEQKNPDADPKWIWAVYQRRWYVAKAATKEEIPTSLKTNCIRSKNRQ